MEETSEEELRGVDTNITSIMKIGEGVSYNDEVPLIHVTNGEIRFLLPWHGVDLDGKSITSALLDEELVPIIVSPLIELEPTTISFKDIGPFTMLELKYDLVVGVRS